MRDATSTIAMCRSNMKRKTYCCDASRHMYENYYADQSGSGIPVFMVSVTSEDTDWGRR